MSGCIYTQSRFLSFTSQHIISNISIAAKFTWGRRIHSHTNTHSSLGHIATVIWFRVDVVGVVCVCCLKPTRALNFLIKPIVRNRRNSLEYSNYPTVAYSSAPQSRTRAIHQALDISDISLHKHLFALAAATLATLVALLMMCNTQLSASSTAATAAESAVLGWGVAVFF